MARHPAAHKHVHSKKKKQPFDYVVYFFTIATPLFELPQLLTIFRSHDASNVAWQTWGFFIVASIVFATYAYREHIMPMLITSLMYAVLESGIVIGIIMYS